MIKDHEDNKREKKVEYECRPQYYEKGQKVGHSCNKERKMAVKIWKSKPDIVEEEDNLRKMMQERNGEDNDYILN